MRDGSRDSNAREWGREEWEGNNGPASLRLVNHRLRKETLPAERWVTYCTGVLHIPVVVHTVLYFKDPLITLSITSPLSHQSLSKLRLVFGGVFVLTLSRAHLESTHRFVTSPALAYGDAAHTAWARQVHTRLLATPQRRQTPATQGIRDATGRSKHPTQRLQGTLPRVGAEDVPKDAS